MVDEAMHTFYERDRERDRLANGLGQLEFARTIEIMLRTFPNAPATVADIGGGPGRYTDWLVEQGYSVEHRDVVPHHVEQVKARYSDDPSVSTAIGDVRSIDLDDASVDAALLLGPMYHLPDHADRAAAVAEATRIVRPGGRIYAAAIGRWAARIQGVLVDRRHRDYEDNPNGLDIVYATDKTGILAPVVDGAFTGYAHTPADFRADFTTPALEVESLLAIEGIASAFTDEDVSERLANEPDRAVLLDNLRALEAIPDLLGASSHLLVTARRR